MGVNEGRARRRELAARALEGYVHGPDAATEATEVALARLPEPRAVALVEGISDQIAVESVAARLGRDLTGERVLVLPVGGAGGIARYLTRFGPDGTDVPLAGLVDAGEEIVARRALTRTGIGEPRSRAELERLGFFVCVDDLEDELIRALGAPQVEAVVGEQGDLGSLQTLQKQPAWRGRPVEAQLRRFFGSGARRKLRYARLLGDAVGSRPDAIPRPLAELLHRVAT